MKNCLELGNRVRTLVDKIEEHASGKIKCPKGVIATICHVEDDFIVVEVNDQNGDLQILSYGINQVELIK